MGRRRLPRPLGCPSTIRLALPAIAAQARPGRPARGFGDGVYTLVLSARTTIDDRDAMARRQFGR